MAGRHPNSILIDGRRELAAKSPRNLLDDHVIQDTHHPTLRGHVALANAVLRELERKQFFARSAKTRPPLDAAACARHFGMDAQRWASMCERTSEHYRRVAGYRYDPAERLEKSRRYAEAAAMIKKGVAPDQVGLPGVGVADPLAGQGPQNVKAERASSAVRLKGRASSPFAQRRGSLGIIQKPARPASPGAARWHPGPGIARRRRTGRHWRA